MVWSIANYCAKFKSAKIVIHKNCNLQKCVIIHMLYCSLSQLVTWGDLINQTPTVRRSSCVKRLPSCTPKSPTVWRWPHPWRPLIIHTDQEPATWTTRTCLAALEALNHLHHSMNPQIIGWVSLKNHFIF